jgi:hypothetical protein
MFGCDIQFEAISLILREESLFSDSVKVKVKEMLSKCLEGAEIFIAIGLLVNTNSFPRFFWLSSFIVALSAMAMRCAGALGGRHQSCPTKFFLKKVMYSNLNCTVCLMLLQVPLTMYSPMRKS